MDCPAQCGNTGFSTEVELRTHLTNECKKIKENTVDFIKLFSGSKPDYFEGIDEKFKLMSKEAQETFEKEKGQLHFGKPPKDYDPAQRTFHTWKNEGEDEDGDIIYYQGEKNHAGEWDGRVIEIYENGYCTWGYYSEGGFNGSGS